MDKIICSNIWKIFGNDEKRILDILVKEQNLEIIDLSKQEVSEDIKTVLPSNYIKINYDGQSAIINFKNEISEEEIHSTLVSMIKDIKK